MMTKKKAERLATSAALDTILAELLALRATVENIARTIDSLDKPPAPAKITDRDWLAMQEYVPALDRLGHKYPDAFEFDTMTTAEAAEVLELSEFTVRKMCQNGTLTATKESNAAGWQIDVESVVHEWQIRYDG